MQCATKREILHSISDNWTDRSCDWLNVRDGHRYSLRIDRNPGSVCSHAIFTSYTSHPLISWRISVFTERNGLEMKSSTCLFWMQAFHFNVFLHELWPSCTQLTWILCLILLCRLLLSAYRLRSIDLDIAFKYDAEATSPRKNDWVIFVAFA